MSDWGTVDRSLKTLILNSKKDWARNKDNTSMSTVGAPSLISCRVCLGKIQKMGNTSA